jgi:hypothetical protein
MAAFWEGFFYRLNIQHIEVVPVPYGPYSTRWSTYLYHVVYIQPAEVYTCTTWSIFNTLKYLPVPHGLCSS